MMSRIAILVRADAPSKHCTRLELVDAPAFRLAPPILRFLVFAGNSGAALSKISFISDCMSTMALTVGL